MMDYKMEYTTESMTEIAKVCTIKKISKCFHEVTIGFIILAGPLYYLSGIISSIILLVSAVIAEIMLIYTKKKLLEKMLGQFDVNSNGTGIIKNDLHFGETSVVIENTLSGGRLEIPYDKFTELKESENYFIILTKYDQFIGVPKEEAERDQLKEYLMPKVKKSRKG